MSDYEEWSDSDSEEVGTEKLISPYGIKKLLLKRGASWKHPFIGDQVTVHYVGILLDGTKFVTTRDNNRPHTFTLQFGSDQVVRGLIVRIANMAKGEIALFTLPSEYAYGKDGRDKVPSDSIVQFEVELISWFRMVDVCKDGGIIKKILKGGIWDEKPTDLDEVVVKYEIMLSDGTLVAKTPEEGVKFDVNSGHLVPAFEKAIQTMDVEEKANLTVKPQYGFEDLEIEAGSSFSSLPPYFGDIHGIMLSTIPSNSSLSINLELVRFKRVFEYCEEAHGRFDPSWPGDMSRERFERRKNGSGKKDPTQLCRVFMVHNNEQQNNVDEQ